MGFMKRLRRFLSDIPWAPLIVGTTLGTFGTLTIQAWVSRTPRANAPLQVAIGILLGGIVGWVIPEFVNSLRLSWGTAQPLRTLLTPFHRNASPISIFLAAMYPTASNVFEKSVPLQIQKTNKVVPHHGIPWVLTESDTRAFGYVMALLAQAGRTANISVVRDDSGIDIADTNLVCIGSPKSNFKTRQINTSFKRLPLRFEIANERQVIVDNEAEHRWEADDMFDYGILAKLPNEYDLDKAVLLLAGISYVGTAGVGYYLFKRWREIEAAADRRYFAMVIKVRRENYQHVEKEWEFIFPDAPK
jgi:hypothetical protein